MFRLENAISVLLNGTGRSGRIRPGTQGEVGGTYRVSKNGRDEIDTTRDKPGSMTGTHSQF